MSTLGRRSVIGGWLCAAMVFLAVIPSQAEEPSKRKLLEHPAPPYPALARNMALEGVVKVDALVLPDGSVKDVNVVGGHPVLAQAAAKIVRQWRWEPSAHESHELVQVKFSPPD